MKNVNRKFNLKIGDGRCVICDSYVRPCTLVHICEECNYGSSEGRCLICGGPGIADAYYCKGCTVAEKDVFNFLILARWLSKNNQSWYSCNGYVL